MVGNRFEGCNNPIVKLVSTIPATTDWLLADNVFRNTVGTHDVSITPNGSGTEGPKRWLVQGNKFSKAVLFQGLNPATTGEAQDILVINNQFGPAATLTLGGDALVRCRESQNQFAANGAYVGSFSRVESDTSVRAGVATQRGYWNNGPIVVVVDGLSGLDGGNWRQIALMIVATGIRPDFSGEFSIAGMVAIKGSVVWGDGGVVITNIAGVVSAAVSAATATSLTLTLNLPAAPSRNSALVSLISFAPGNLA
jgi:hypothetical protein